MAAVTLESARRSIDSGKLKPVYYLTGDQEILKEELARDIARAVVDESSRDFNVDIRSAGDVDGESLTALIETPPMLADKRFVMVKNLEQWRSNAKVWKVLRAYLRDPSPTTLLVLTQGGGKTDRELSRLSAHVDITSLDPDHLMEWIVERAKQSGLTMAPEAAIHLAGAMGSDPASLALEIDKLAAAAPTDRPLTVSDVGQIVGIRAGETVSDWVGAVLLRDPLKGVDLVDRVLAQAGINAVRMVMALGTALVGVRLARGALDAGKSPRQVEGIVYNQLKAVRPPRIGDWRELSRLWTRAAQQWTAPELDRAIQSAYAADLALKSTTLTDSAGTLATLTLELVAGQAAA